MMLRFHDTRPLVHTLCRAMLALACLTSGAAAAQTSGPGTPQSRPLIISGSSTVYPLMTDIARRFETRNPGVRIEVRSGGSGKGISDLRADLCDIAMISRPVAANEHDLFAFPLSRDGAAVVVNRSNTVKGLTSQQLADVLTGKVTDRKQVGGRPGPIRVAWRTEGQGIPDLLLQHLKLKYEQVKHHAIFFENADAIKFAANERNGVAVAALGVAERSVKAGMPVRLLAYEGVPASSTAVREHLYALSRPLILLTRTVPTGLQERVIDFARSKAVVDLHEKHGFVTYQE